MSTHKSPAVGGCEKGQADPLNRKKYYKSPCPEIDISVSKLLGFETFAKSLRVSVSEKKSLFRFRKKLVSEKSLGFGLENLVSEKKSRFRKNLVSKKSLGLGFGKFGLGKEKIQITRTVLVLMMSQIWDLVPIGT